MGVCGECEKPLCSKCMKNFCRYCKDDPEENERESPVMCGSCMTSCEGCSEERGGDGFFLKRRWLPNFGVTGTSIVLDLYGLLVTKEVHSSVLFVNSSLPPLQHFSRQSWQRNTERSRKC